MLAVAFVKVKLFHGSLIVGFPGTLGKCLCKGKDLKNRVLALGLYRLVSRVFHRPIFLEKNKGNQADC